MLSVYGAYEASHFLFAAILIIYKWGCCYLRAAKQSKSPAELVGVLMDNGFASSGDTRSFAEEIFARVPHQTAAVNVSSSKLYCSLLCFPFEVKCGLLSFFFF